MKTNTDKPMELTRQEKIYFELKDLVKALGNTVWGSAAFDIEVSKARNNINKIMDDEKAQAIQATREEVDAGWVLYFKDVDLSSKAGAKAAKLYLKYRDSLTNKSEK